MFKTNIIGLTLLPELKPFPCYPYIKIIMFIEYGILVNSALSFSSGAAQLFIVHSIRECHIKTYFCK